MPDHDADPNAHAPAAAPEPQEPRASPDRPRSGWDETKLDFKWATVLLFVLVLATPLLVSVVGFSSGGTYGPWAGRTTGEEDLTNITEAFFSQGEYRANVSANGTPLSAQAARGPGSLSEPGLVVPFEILSVLLLAALIAGVVIALRETDGGD